MDDNLLDLGRRPVTRGAIGQRRITVDQIADTKDIVVHQNCLQTETEVCF
jgi:hypothetical protein